MLRTLTCLVRTPEALDAAHAALRALLAPLPGAPPLAEPLPAARPDRPLEWALMLVSSVLVNWLTVSWIRSKSKYWAEMWKLFPTS